jgi:hypothetical protein
MVRKITGLGVLLVYLFFCILEPTYASALQSSNYRFNESVVGGGGLTQENSANYQAGEFLGDLAIGNSTSTNYQINSGYDTTSDPALTFIVDTSSLSFGSFSPSTTAVTSSTFEVIDYTSYGYIVQILGTPPTNGAHVINAMVSTGPSQAGVEQFGINLVANISPVTFGANPNNGSFGFGTAATNYNTANQYRYVSGETIASGPKSSGNTIYTLSYLVNVTSTTLGGQYTSNQTLICIGTY